MQNLLPPRLKCRPNPCKTIWMSNVIPAFKMRPLAKTNEFLGYQLALFAMKTKKNVVFDAQLDLDVFRRTGNFSCIRTCDHGDMQTICAGRVNLKDNFLKGCNRGYIVSHLCMMFFEDGVCRVLPQFKPGKQDDYQIQVCVARGRDYRGHEELSTADFTLEYMFDDCGKSLSKFIREQTKNV